MARLTWEEGNEIAEAANRMANPPDNPTDPCVGCDIDCDDEDDCPYMEALEDQVRVTGIVIPSWLAMEWALDPDRTVQVQGNVNYDENGRMTLTNVSVVNIGEEDDDA